MKAWDWLLERLGIRKRPVKPRMVSELPPPEPQPPAPLPPVRGKKHGKPR